MSSGNSSRSQRYFERRERHQRNIEMEEDDNKVYQKFPSKRNRMSLKYLHEQQNFHSV